MKRTKIDCCYKCTERQADPNCHGYCERYLKQRAELDESNEEKNKMRDTASSIAAQKSDFYHKETKRIIYRAKYRKWK